MPGFCIFCCFLISRLLNAQLSDFQEVIFKQFGLRARCRELHFYFGFQLPYLGGNFDKPFPECFHRDRRQSFYFEHFIPQVMHQHVGSRMQKQPELVGVKAVARHPPRLQISFVVFNIEFHPTTPTVSQFV